MAEENDNKFLELFTQVTNSNERMVQHTEQLVAIHGDVRTLIEQLGGLIAGAPTSGGSTPVAQGALADLRFNYLNIRSQLGHERATPTTASAVLDRDHDEVRFTGPAAMNAKLAILWLLDRESPNKTRSLQVALTATGDRVACPLSDLEGHFGVPTELRDQNGTRVAVVAWPAEVFREV